MYDYSNTHVTLHTHTFKIIYTTDTVFIHILYNPVGHVYKVMLLWSEWPVRV